VHLAELGLPSLFGGRGAPLDRRGQPATAGKFAFPTAPGSKVSADCYPLRMCEAFWPDLGGQVKSTNESEPKKRSVHHSALGEAAEQALGMSKDARKVSSARTASPG